MLGPLTQCDIEEPSHKSSKSESKSIAVSFYAED